MGACLGCFRTEATQPRRSQTAELHVVSRQNVPEEENYINRVPPAPHHGSMIIHEQNDSSLASPPQIRRARSASLDLKRQRTRVTKNVAATFPFRKRPTEHSMEE